MSVASRSSQSKFRLPGLDGLRAIAALAVLAYHAMKSHFPGGFTGVDVFFVLSGFLITGLLVQQHRSRGKIALWQFWLRRFRRLFPAVCATAVVMVTVALFVSKELLVGIRHQFFSTLTFTYNWAEIFSGSSYFATWNPNLLRNMWSLAVEQQFYLVWPLILLLLFRSKPKLAAWAAALLGCGSLAVMWFLNQQHADLTRVYQGTDSHLFPLMVGATLALALPYPLSRVGDTSGGAEEIPVWQRFTRGFLGWLGLGLVVAGFFFINDDAGWVYPWGLLFAALSTMLVIQAMVDQVSGAAGPGSWLARFLDFWPLRWLGERSYSLYLWHWPILVVLNSLFPMQDPWWALCEILVLSVLAAALSYRWIETPMRYEGIWATLNRWFGFANSGKGVSGYGG